MFSYDELKSAEYDSIKKQLSDGEETLITVAVDLNRKKEFSREWLIVTNKHLLIIEDGKFNERRRKIPLTEIKQASCIHEIGIGRIEAETAEEFVVLAYYTNSISRKIGEAVAGINQLIKGETLSIASVLEQKYCAKCGSPLPEPDGLCIVCFKKSRTLFRILSYLSKYKFFVFSLIIITFLKTASQLVPPYITKIIIDDVLTPSINDPSSPKMHFIKYLAVLVLILACMRLLLMGLQILGGLISSFLGNTTTFNIRSEIYRKLEFMPLSFHNRKQVGGLISRVSNDSQRLQDFLVEAMPFIVTNFLTMIGIFVILLKMDWVLTLFVLIPVPFIGVLSNILRKKMHTLFHKWWHSWSRFTAYVSESLSGVKVVKAFSQENSEIERFGKRNESLFSSGFSADKYWFVFMSSMSLITGLGILITWFVGGFRIINNESMTIGTLVAFISYLMQFYGPIENVSHIYNWMSKALSGAERIFEILDEKEEPYNDPNAKRVKEIRGEVVFENVTFGYDKSKPVIHDANFHINPGEMIGMVGKSGAGKTTITNLICRFYDADRGAIKIDGNEIKTINLSDLRRQLGVVLQEPFLFDASIRENIAYAKPDATIDEIIAVSRAANAHNFILSKPDGYDTVVGEKGNKLSVGEKQRISIARALLTDPKILILDEASSSVDTETEKAIQTALVRLIKGRTTVAIAHRLSTLRNATRLIVIENGIISEMGTHDELIEKKGIYYNLVQIQKEMSDTKQEAVFV